MPHPLHLALLVLAMACPDVHILHGAIHLIAHICASQLACIELVIMSSAQSEAFLMAEAVQISPLAL